MLHRKTLAPHSLGLLTTLMGKPYLKDFCLVGGTSLSLQIGHRISLDLDLFGNLPFDTNELKAKLSEDYKSVQVGLERENTLLAEIDGTKVDFIRFKYGFAYPLTVKDGIRLADIKDIAPMKLDAVSGRGRKKDFFDLYFLLQYFSLPQLLELYQTKYNHTTLFHIIKSIGYFDEAEGETDPIVFDKKVTWEKVKKEIVKEVRKI